MLDSDSSARRVSVFMITLNEADRIGKSIAAATRISNDIVVVDCGSTDGTQNIAEAMGARVIYRAWDGYGRQKNFAQDQCKSDWVFNLDADEVLSEELISEVNEMFSGEGPSADAYTVKIVDVMPGRSAPRRFAYFYDPVRLYQKDKGAFSLSPVHDRVQLQGGVVCSGLKGKIYHFSIRSVGDQISKFNKYSDLQVDDLVSRGKKFHPGE